MASTYSSDTKLELITTGEKAGQWGGITNTNLQILEQVASGVLGASRFAVPTIVTVPIPSVSGLPVASSVTASAAIFGLPILATKLLPVAIIVTVLSAPS